MQLDAAAPATLHPAAQLDVFGYDLYGVVVRRLVRRSVGVPVHGRRRRLAGSSTGTGSSSLLLLLLLLASRCARAHAAASP